MAGKEAEKEEVKVSRHVLAKQKARAAKSGSPRSGGKDGNGLKWLRKHAGEPWKSKQRTKSSPKKESFKYL